MSTDKQILPRDLSGSITLANANGPGDGGFGDIWIGIWRDGERDVLEVVVKVLRPRFRAIKKNSEKKMLGPRREIQVWKRLDHPNIVPLLGTTTDFGCRSFPGTLLGMVSQRMRNGNLNEFLKLDLSLEERLQLLRDVATGLAYLHSKDIIHGDLTAANVLIDDNRNARLIDFGLSSIKIEFEGTSYWTSTVGGAVRWRAPELVPGAEHIVTDAFVPVLTKACDIYSFGNIVLQTISGVVPYHNVPHAEHVFIELFHRRKPHRPQMAQSVFLTDTYWDFINDCWGEAPTSRPSVDEVNKQVDALYDLATL